MNKKDILSIIIALFTFYIISLINTPFQALNLILASLIGFPSTILIIGILVSEPKGKKRVK